VSAEDAQNLLDSQALGTSFWDAPDTEVEQYRDAPVFDGPYSNSCYVDRVREAVQHVTENSGQSALTDWDHLVFHLPYAYQGRRMWPEIALEWYEKAGRLAEIEEATGMRSSDGGSAALAKAWSKTGHYQALVAAKMAPAERVSQVVGNGYTASIFLALTSLLEDAREQNRSLAGERVALLAYGSGSKSKVATGVVQPAWLEGLAGVSVWRRLETRCTIDADLYVALHTGRREEPVSPAHSTESVRWTGNRTEPLLVGYRQYV
jgi:hydroxymethylglutaryl-CoA synthase